MVIEFEVRFKDHKPILISANTLRDANKAINNKCPELEPIDFYDCGKKQSNIVIAEGDKHQIVEEKKVLWPIFQKWSWKSPTAKY